MGMPPTPVNSTDLAKSSANHAVANGIVHPPPLRSDADTQALAEGLADVWQGEPVRQAA